MKSNRMDNATQTAEADYELLLVEEELILEAQMLIQRAINEASITQKELADLLDVRPSYVSQMLGDSARNLTLRTIARVLHALGRRAEIRLGDLVSSAELESAPGETSFFANDDAKGFFDSKVWGQVADLTSAGKRKAKSKREKASNDAHDYAAYDAPYYALAA